VTTPLAFRRVRPVGGPGEWNIKGHLFEVVETETDDVIEFAVPKGSSRMIVRRLTGAG